MRKEGVGEGTRCEVSREAFNRLHDDGVSLRDQRFMSSGLAILCKVIRIWGRFIDESRFSFLLLPSPAGPYPHQLRPGQEGSPNGVR